MTLTVAIGEERFDCDPECVEFVSNRKSVNEISHRKGHHEYPDNYVRQNTALAALHGWGKKINPVGELPLLDSSFGIASIEMRIGHGTHRVSVIVPSRSSRHGTGQIRNVVRLLSDVSSTFQFSCPMSRPPSSSPVRCLVHLPVLRSRSLR